MNLRAIVTSLPLVRRVWWFLPGPLRIPLLAIGAGVFVWRRMTGRNAEQQDGEPSADPAQRDRGGRFGG